MWLQETHDDGFAVEFLRMQHPDFVEESVTGA